MLGSLCRMLYLFKSVAKLCSLQKHEMEDSEIVS